MIDIDLFKDINDGHGHTGGDQALMQFADALRSEFRTTDLIGRWGGEEFIVMMPETAPDAATAKVDRFVKHVADRNFELPRNGAALRMTVSAGVAGVPNDVDDPGRLLEFADARLLAAKRAGRNRVVGARVHVPGLT
jgi:two-component system cell cycle response regulator